MKTRSIITFIILSTLLIFSSCANPEKETHVSTDSNEETSIDSAEEKFELLPSKPDWVNSNVSISASKTKVWNVITNPDFAKILGNEFDKNAYVESDWKLGSKVNFNYEPGNTIVSGDVVKLVEQELIEVDYDFKKYIYKEKFRLFGDSTKCTFELQAGPYEYDLKEQKVVWNNWINKVKELSESN